LTHLQNLDELRIKQHFILTSLLVWFGSGYSISIPSTELFCYRPGKSGFVYPIRLEQVWVANCHKSGTTKISHWYTDVY